MSTNILYSHGMERDAEKKISDITELFENDFQFFANNFLDLKLFIKNC